MMELKYLSDRELAARIVGYIERLDNLDSLIGEARKNKSSLYDSCEIQLIQFRYSQLKEEILADAKYLNTEKSHRQDSDTNLYDAFFRPAICYTAAYGLKAPINSHNLSKLADAVLEAKYYISQFYSLDEWKAIKEMA